MTINGIFFDLYGTLLVYENMDVAWADWLNTLHEQLRLRGLTLSIESLAKTCDRFFSKSEPTPRQHNLTVFEQRIQNLCFDLKLNLTSEDIKLIANKIVNAWQKHISLDPEAHSILHTLHRSKKLALVSNFDHPPHVHSVLSKLGLTPYFDSVVKVSRNPIRGYLTRLLNRLEWSLKKSFMSETPKMIQKPPVPLVLR